MEQAPRTSTVESGHLSDLAGSMYWRIRRETANVGATGVRKPSKTKRVDTREIVRSDLARLSSAHGARTSADGRDRDRGYSPRALAPLASSRRAGAPERSADATSHLFTPRKTSRCRATHSACSWARFSSKSSARMHTIQSAPLWRVRRHIPDARERFARSLGADDRDSKMKTCGSLRSFQRRLPQS